MSNPINFHHFFVEQVSELIVRSNDKYSCIEDQFYHIDQFPKYKVDGDTVFKCADCECLVQVDCLIECDKCEKNFCDFTHTLRSICDKKHECGKRNMRIMRPKNSYNHEYSIWCMSCIQIHGNPRSYYPPVPLQYRYAV